MGPAKRTLAIVALTTTLVSCSGQEVPATTPTMASESLQVYSTTATFPLMLELTSSYIQLEPFITFDTRQGNYENMAAALLNDEMPYFISNYLPAESDFWAAPIGQDSIAIITDPDIGVTDLSSDELRAIYQGRINTWSELGGPEQDIIVFSRENGSGTRAQFDRMVMGFRPTTSTARIAPSSRRMLESVAATSGGIGYISMGHINASVTPLTIDGITLTIETVSSARYPLRSMIFIVGQTEPTDEYRRFFGWIQSPEGQRIVGQLYAPLPAYTEASE